MGRVFGLYGGWWIGCPHTACSEAGRKTEREEKGATDLGSVSGNRRNTGCNLVERAKFSPVYCEWKASHRAGHAGDRAWNDSQQFLGDAESAAAGFQIFGQEIVAAGN